MGIPLQDLSHLGDPSGMEALASELLLRADSVAGIAQSLSRQVEEMTFEGPAADVLRDHTDERRRRAQRLAAELEDAAHLLKRTASVAREEIHQVQLAARRQEEDGS